MPSQLGHINQADNETMRAIVCAATAAGIGWAMGASVKRSAAIAGLVFSEPDRWIRGKFNPLLTTVSIGTLLVLAGSKSRLSFSLQDLLAAGAGTCAGTILWSYSPTKDLDYKAKKIERPLPALVYPLIGWVVGKCIPNWFSPSHGALLFASAHALKLVTLHGAQTIAWKLGRELKPREKKLADVPPVLFSLLDIAKLNKEGNRGDGFLVSLIIFRIDAYATSVWKRLADKKTKEN